MKPELELKHIAPYLPYGLEWKRNNDDSTYEVTSIDTSMPHVLAELGFCNKEEFGIDSIDKGKPILRPISSMTKEEAKEFSMLALSHCVKDDSSLLDLDVKTDKVSGTTINCSFSEIMFNYIHTVTTYSICVCGDFIKIVDKETGQVVSVSYSLYEWLFENHFDVFGLIDKGLAIEKK